MSTANAPAKVHATEDRMAICTKAKKIRFGRKRDPAWVYRYDDGSAVTVMVEDVGVDIFKEES